MRALVLAALGTLLAQGALAEMRDEEHLVGDKMVRITVIDTFEIMTVGPTDYDQVQALSGADVEIVPLEAYGVAALDPPVLLADVTGTHSCDEGDARAYWVVTLGDVPTPEGPVTTCEEMAASVTASGQVLLEGKAETWVWASGKGWAAPAS